MSWLFPLLAALVVAVVVVLMTLVGSGNVLMMDRARGVHPSLRALLEDWDRTGAHRVVVALNGGLRSSADTQAELAAAGMSNATTLQVTPHGRGGAIDVWPLSFLPHVPVSSGGTALRWSSWEQLPQGVKDDFRVFGEWAEARGFKWGGRWRSAKFPNGDQPHIELANWSSLPFPIPGGSYA